jgi:bifunctional UDP-N-acetylglucosamine pyrophosphorylase/glucosamine-1-phosphate N-acetyltransferase
VVSNLGLPYRLHFVVQEPQLGTGHAVQQVLPFLPLDTAADVLVTCGDMPLVPSCQYVSLWESYETKKATAMLVTVAMPNPFGYGRVLFTENRFTRIVEEKDATAEERQVPWINAGIYLADWQAFAPQLASLQAENAQKEFYLTDVLGFLAQDPKNTVLAEQWLNPDEVLGINSRHQLAQAERLLSTWTANRLMDEGVSLIHPDSMTLAPEVVIGRDTVLHPGCYLLGDIHIGSHCEIGPQTTMRGVIRIADHCRVVCSYLDRAVSIGANSYIGPYAHLRDNTIVGEQVRLGNFVEVKETRIGSRSNAAHLSYLGDAEIGDDVNMGAGSIIANYDPIRDLKHRTTIEDGVKVGCNSVLVSPVTVQERSCVAAGSVITQTVAPWDLAIARARQTALPHWVKMTLEKSESTTPSPST